tara:strand:+ start:173 stop:535 length:363 start_codon:yes stop_codon:yes gene_type:complete
MNHIRLWLQDVTDIIFLVTIVLIILSFAAYKLEKFFIKQEDLRYGYQSGTCELCLGVEDANHMALVHPTKVPIFYRFILGFSVIMIFAFLLSIDCQRPEYETRKFDPDMQGYDSARNKIN